MSNIVYLNVDDDFISRYSRLVHSKCTGLKKTQTEISLDTTFSIPGRVEHDNVIHADIFRATVPVAILWRDNLGQDHENKIFTSLTNGVETSRISEFITEQPKYTDVSID
jgi:hypothetical protein